jgi:hypothetical protein
LVIVGFHGVPKGASGAFKHHTFTPVLSQRGFEGFIERIGAPFTQQALLMEGMNRNFKLTVGKAHGNLGHPSAVPGGHEKEKQ